jgi:hypothetical protein
MKYLYGTVLTKKIQELCRSSEKLDIAIAYWGSNALELLPISWERRDVRIVCCLAGGKSAPEVIRLFGDRARQNDRLHAKVIWTPHGAVVGSANASSNGLPEEESRIAGLIEAGVFIDERCTLDEIAGWFETLFLNGSRAIKPSDLDAAALARRPAGGAGSKMSILDMVVAGNGRISPQVPISILIYREENTKEQDVRVRTALADKAEKKRIRQLLQADDRSMKNLDWYTDWPGLPCDHFLIDCHLMKSGQLKVHGFAHTFADMRPWQTTVSGEQVDYYFVSMRGRKGPNCLLTEEDEVALQACSKKLWKAASGRGDGKILSLSEAAPTFLDYINEKRLLATKLPTAHENSLMS